MTTIEKQAVETYYLAPSYDNELVRVNEVYLDYTEFECDKHDFKPTEFKADYDSNDKFDIISVNSEDEDKSDIDDDDIEDDDDNRQR